ncbi:hypothetical protein [Halanaerobium kushneri]|jgi:hypothetical protein|uniref:Uncharacterized protein n=1 Tax=Halanaerobium kushneri TaxID=56779 RepID=A0A1N6YSF3_9FIRM|nr:hypothetical protein [Halanaerobium kushneri]SIR17530.1 hypothetical protein SAMN05421834_11540 [Halanaerobium kushneri]
MRLLRLKNWGLSLKLKTLFLKAVSIITSLLLAVLLLFAFPLIAKDSVAGGSFSDKK